MGAFEITMNPNAPIIAQVYKLWSINSTVLIAIEMQILVNNICTWCNITETNQSLISAKYNIL